MRASECKTDEIIDVIMANSQTHRQPATQLKNPNPRPNRTMTPLSLFSAYSTDETSPHLSLLSVSVVCDVTVRSVPPRGGKGADTMDAAMYVIMVVCLPACLPMRRCPVCPGRSGSKTRHGSCADA
mmetsp:Transcript_45362/g.128009  ORF Transcript_45362/g.128009 Transcript_45362/m.128009 type:complete len:126 (-) Transcript_45362:1038-1415(-)